MERFNKEPNLRQLAAQFVLLKIDSGGGRDWDEWSSKYKYKGKGIPIIYVVRADGKQLHGGSGAPDKLAHFLAKHLKQSGNLLSIRQIKTLEKNAERTRKLVKQVKIRQAVGLMNSSSRIGSGSYAQAALTFNELTNKLTEQGEATLKEIEAQLQSKESQFQGVFSFVKLKRQFGKLPTLRKAIQLAERKYHKNPELKELIQPAKILLRAEEFEADKKRQRALSEYQLVASKYQDSAAALLAEKRIAVLKEQGTTASKSVSKSSGSKTEEPADANEKKAYQQLRLGKLMIKQGKPEKSGKYLKRAIKLAPQSPIADEARKLLRELR